jgi:crotonobetainyl-CoA:carnitine CoA-transferase CaiB-like acyl-CoA transferase
MLDRQARASGQEPTDSVLAIGDTVAGLQSVIAILAALRRRESSGRGQHVDMAMHDALLSIQEAANFYLFGAGGRETDYLCSWVYRCGDDYVAIPSDPRAHWKELTAVMGRPELLTDERYDTYPKRAERLEELEGYVQEWVSSHANGDEVVADLDDAGLPGARIVPMSEALDCEQTRARRMTPEVDDRSGRPVRVLNSPYRFSDAAAGVRGLPAFRGEDNRDILSTLLGLSEAEIDELEAAGVVSARPRRPNEG